MAQHEKNRTTTAGAAKAAKAAKKKPKLRVIIKGGIKYVTKEGVTTGVNVATGKVATTSGPSAAKPTEGTVPTPAEKPAVTPEGFIGPGEGKVMYVNGKWVFAPKVASTPKRVRLRRKPRR